MLPNSGGNSAHRGLVPLIENGNNPSSPVQERQVKFLGNGCGTVSSTFEIGITTFAETYPEVGVATARGHGRRLREVVEEAQLADEVGLDVYGVGEHHREDFAASAPAVLLHISMGTMPHEKVLRSIELLGREVAPIVREAMAEEPRRETVHS